MPTASLSMPATTNPRAAAASALTLVLRHGHSLNKALPLANAMLHDARDQALARSLTYGVLRHLSLLEAHCKRYLTRPLKTRDADIQLLLLCGLFQLGWQKTPAYATVSATVDAAQAMGKGWARGLVNAVLRSYQRDTCPMAIEGLSVNDAYSHPRWLWQALERAWHDQTIAIAKHNNAPPPFWLRANRQRGTRAEYIADLAVLGMTAKASPWATDALHLETAVGVTDLPGFAAGRVSVQDAAAQIAADLMAIAPRQRVLDACAAPGGKTAHLLEREPSLDVTAVDIDRDRTRRIDDNLARLNLRAKVRVGDVLTPDRWWCGQAFDRILLDAPCSATGVIRRHPDIKWLRREGDIEHLAKRQLALLKALWPLLRSGGRLVYATCSVLPAENADVLDAFIAQSNDSRALDMEYTWGSAAGPGRQILPGHAGMDGFYYAVLEKLG